MGPLFATAVVFGVWEILSWFIPPLLFPSPVVVIRDGIVLLQRGALSGALVISLREMYLGLFAALVVGIILGFAVARYQLANAVARPFIDFFNATPLNVLIPMLVILVGVGVEARLLFIAGIAVWPVLLNTAAGIGNVDRGYIDVGRAFGLTERAVVWKILMRAALPYIFAGVRLGIAMAIVGMIIGELEISEVGLGYLLDIYGGNFQIGNLLVVIFISSLVGMVNVIAASLIYRRWFSWAKFAK